MTINGITGFEHCEEINGEICRAKDILFFEGVKLFWISHGRVGRMLGFMKWVGGECIDIIKVDPKYEMEGEDIWAEVYDTFSKIQ